MKRLLLYVIGMGLLACGGRYEEPGTGTGTPVAGPTGSTGAPSDGKAGSSGSTVTLPDHDLGMCQPGFDRASNPGRSCNWLTDSGKCFDTKDAACNCICPRSGESLCSSGVDGGPGSATLVHCA
ncbi:MAG TPA: hypothetical protein VGL19_13600 [Polyangiaceae bacterium]